MKNGNWVTALRLVLQQPVIDTVYSKLMKYVSIFYKMKNKLPLSVLRNIYFAVVYPHILYGIEVMFLLFW